MNKTGFIPKHPGYTQLVLDCLGRPWLSNCTGTCWIVNKPGYDEMQWAQAMNLS